MKNDPTEPYFNEEDVEDYLMYDLPTGGETLPLTQEDQESCDALSRFFSEARNF